MIDKLKEMADVLIIINKDNPKELQKYTLIKEILNKEDCFHNMSIEYAYSILRDLQITESDLKSYYSQLI